MEDAVDLVSFIGFVAIGAALAVPLAYGLATLLGMTHKQFRPIFHRKQPDGMTVPIINGENEPSVEQHKQTHKQ
jgi:hypothetical protein